MKPNKYKLLVVDIDGTLLNRQGKISPADVAAINHATQAGVQVVLSTGRVPQACHWILKELGLDGYHIFFDGALVINPETGHEVYAEPISGELVRQTTEFARRQALHYDIFSSTKYFIEHDDWAVEIRRHFFRLEPVMADFDEISRTERIIKGTVIVRPGEEATLATDFQDHFLGRLAFSWTNTPAYPDVSFINVISPQVSKGKALEELCRRLGVELAEVVAIGDGVNDVSLLKNAGLAVAMGNSPEALRAVAHKITSDVEHSGVAEAITTYLL